MTIKVFGIAPYPGLADILKEVGAEQDGIEITVATADLRESLPLVRKAEEDGYEVIVSRGGTASMIRRSVSLPVIDISVSGFDILRILTLIKGSASEVAMIGFQNVCSGVTTILSLLGFEVPVHTVTNEQDVPQVIRHAARMGARMILGDVVTIRTAGEMGYNGILITSGRESAEAAVLEARNIGELLRLERRKTYQYRTISERSPYPVVATDRGGTIFFANALARKILGVDELNGLVGQPLSNMSILLDGLLLKARDSGEPISRESVTMHGQRFLVDVLLGKSEQDESDQYIMHLLPPTSRDTEISTQTSVRPVTFTQIMGRSKLMQTAINRAQLCASAEQNVWISGPIGSGRKLFAQAIHFASKRSSLDFHVVSCKAEHPQDVEAELFGIGGSQGLLTTNRGTIYLEDVDQLSESAQNRLLSHLDHTESRVISSSVLPWNKMISSERFDKNLAYALGQLYLPIPALRGHSQDIEEIVPVMIAEHNLNYGKQVVGLRREVLKLLEDYDWPGNVTELKIVVRELLLQTKGHYAGLDEYEIAWQRYSSELTDAPKHRRLSIDFTGSLQDIERRILLKILDEEGMSQSKAAKRLGISRTTLWRKLNEVKKT